MNDSTMTLTCIFAIFLGLIPAAIAQNKGHNFLIWWIFGAALFIVALPLAILLKPNTKEMEQHLLQNSELKKCPYCAEIIKKEAIVCKHCGRDLPIQEYTTQLASEQLSHGRAISDYLSDAEVLAREGNFSEATKMLEDALTEEPFAFSIIAGDPDEKPSRGYAILLQLASESGNKELALEYFRRMIELNPTMPENAKKAARKAGIEVEAKALVSKMKAK